LESRLAPSADVLGYHNDGFSTGQDLSETELTPANVNVADFGKLFSTPVDGYVYAQPLYKSGVNIPTGPGAGTHNVAYVATEHDSVYAIDADSGQVLWKDSLIDPASGSTSVPSSDIGGVIQPEIGITSTPVIDPATNTLYVVAYSKEVRGGANHYVYRLHALDLSSGQEQFGGQLLIADTILAGVNFTYVSGPAVIGIGAGGSGGTVPFNAVRQLQRPALTLVNGTLYVAFGSHNDQSPAHGWVLGFNHADVQSRLQLVAAFNTTPNGGLGSIWQSGGAITADNNGNLYFVTGNGTFESTLDASGFPVNGDYGDSIVKLAPDPNSNPTHQNKNGWGLQVVDYFTPHNQQALANADLDLGSGGPLLLPDAAGSFAHPHLLAAGGKDGTLYLIDRDNMGKFDAATDHVVQVVSGLFPQGLWGPAAYFNGTMYVVGSGTAGAAATTFSIANARISAQPTSLSMDTFGFQGSVPSISANGASNGIVWDLDRSSGQLRAHDASSYVGELYASNQASNARDRVGTVVKFTLPTIANGHVYVGTSNALVAYGLLGPRTSAPTTPSGLAATAVSGNQVRLTWTDNSNNLDRFDIQLSLDGTTFTTIGTANISATSYFVSGLQPSATYTFRVDAANSLGASPFSNTAVVLTPSGPVNSVGFRFLGGFAQAVGFVSLNGSAKIVGSALQLTDGGPNEAGSAFFGRRVDSTNFTTQFSFQLPSASADGFTFTLQAAGPNAFGSNNGGLGYKGIANSMAVKFDLFNTSGEGPDSTGLYTAGAPPTNAGSIDLTPTGLDLHSGHVFNVTLSYDGTILRSVIADSTTGVSAAQAYPVNIPAILGDNTAFAGFTAGTGGLTAIQNILHWIYTASSVTAPAPKHLMATGGNGQVQLQWDTSTGATAYNVYRGLAPGREAATPYVAGVTTTSFTDTGTAFATTYYYRVSATNFGGVGIRSNEALATTAAAPPAGLTAIAVGTNITFSWSASIGAASYNIYRGMNSQGEGSIPFHTGVTGTSFIDTSGSSGATYYYQVTAVNAGGESGKGSEAAATLAPSAPALTAAAAAGGITLTWAAPPGATGYNVYRSTSAGGEGPPPYQSLLSTPAFTDSGLAAGATYYYRVTAVNGGGESSFSNEVLGTIPLVDFSSSFNSAGSSLKLNGSAAVSGSLLQLTNGGVGEVASAFTTNRFNVTNFNTQFRFQLKKAAADGFTFCIQGVAPTAIGNGGGGLGYGATSTGSHGGIPQSVAIKFDLFDNAGEGNDSTGLYTDGARPTNAGSQDLTSSGVDLHSGDIFAVMMNYEGGILKVTITDTVTQALATHSYAVDIPTIVGSNTGFVGFTGATGAVTATQNILSWTYSPALQVPPVPINVSMTPGVGQLSLAWAASAGATSYNVYRSTSSGGEGATPYKTGIVSPSFTDTGLVAGATYYYEVTAVNFSGESGRSTEVSASVQSAAHIESANADDANLLRSDADALELLQTPLARWGLPPPT
jgi:fibronectin type 3 domain-containing protein